MSLLEPESMPLARRWVAALMLVPKDQREDVVASVESRIVDEFDRPDHR